MTQEEMNGIIIDKIIKNFHALEDICYGPITKDHAIMYLNEHCFDDPPEDIAAVKKIIKAERLDEGYR